MRGRPSLSFFLLIAIAFVSPSAVRGQTASPAEPVTTASTAAPAAVPDSSKPLPSVAEILQKYETAEGGREAWTHFTTRFMKGIYQTEDASFFAAIERSDKAPNKTFSKITMPNGVIVREVCDGKSAWIEDARGGIHDFVGAALESHLREARFDSGVILLLAISSGKTVTTAQVGPHSTYVVDFSPQKDISSKVYFDTETGFPVRVDDILHRADGDFAVQTFLDDYRPVDGVYFPFRIRHVEKGNVFTVRVTQIKDNPPIDDSLFQKPDVVTSR
jgi:outer membrane lipoprotein-sorting protein